MKTKLESKIWEILKWKAQSSHVFEMTVLFIWECFPLLKKWSPNFNKKVSSPCQKLLKNPMFDITKSCCYKHQSRLLLELRVNIFYSQSVHLCPGSGLKKKKFLVMWVVTQSQNHYYFFVPFCLFRFFVLDQNVSVKSILFFTLQIEKRISLLWFEI